MCRTWKQFTIANGVFIHFIIVIDNDAIALDLDGDGVEFVKNAAYFDYDGNKFAEKATWIGKDDGWLTRDVNGDGVINNGTELFGDATRKKDGTLAQTPFEALAELDDNLDGVIDKLEGNVKCVFQVSNWKFDV